MTQGTPPSPLNISESDQRSPQRLSELAAEMLRDAQPTGAQPIGSAGMSLSP